MMLAAESFRPAPCLRNGHLQTIFREYSLLEDTIKDPPVSVTIITAKDESDHTCCGFLSARTQSSHQFSHSRLWRTQWIYRWIFLKSWYEQKLADLFDQIILNGK